MQKIVFILLFSFVSLFAFEELTMDNFNSKIKNKNVIVDFYASWCPPCKIMAKSLEEFDVIDTSSVEIYNVNVDEETVLTQQFGIKQLPTIIFFKNGKPVKKFIGVLSPEELSKASKEYFK